MNNIHDSFVQYEKEKTVGYLKVAHLSIHQADRPGTSSAYMLKRFFDLTVSLIVIIGLLSWLLPVLAILIKLTSRGPIFFVQKRVGAYGKVFNCFKLRTMIVNEQADTRQAEENDPRITPFGNFLRLSCFDELPQFFNVLLGDMSIVGPRPHMLKDCKEFSKIIKYYNSRTLVKPGITGMAQVKGYRGKTKNFYDVSHRFKWDMFYVRNLSFKLDVRILRLTIFNAASAIFAGLLIPIKKKTTKPIAYRFESSEYLN